jgi:hypothetical protein
MRNKHMLCSIDPGLKGSAAFFVRGNLVDAITLPLREKGSKEILDARRLWKELAERYVLHTVIEDVFTRSGQGVSSNGALMQAKGICIGVAESLGSSSFVTPTVWKRHFGLIGKDKEASRLLAIELFPDKANLFTPKRRLLTKRAAQDNAEAALIGRWYWEKVGSKVERAKLEALFLAAASEDRKVDS